LTDGLLAGVANAFRAGFNAVLPPDQTMQIELVGGADGVTAANQFEASAAPDGETALLVSGSAALAWQVGDPRAQFDVGHWLPIATAQVSGVLISGSQTGLRPGRLRLAVEVGASAALPAQLGLYLLGHGVQLVAAPDALRVLAHGDADAAFIVGSNVASRTIEAVMRGMVPLFSLGSLDNANQLQRDTFLPNIPTLPELLANASITPDPALLAAWRAVAAAARLDTALLLPWLTPANVVAWWRTACGDIAASGALPGDAAKGSVVWHTDPTGNFGLNAIITDTNTSLALHRWLANQPG
jgi:hypothetical protein